MAELNVKCIMDDDLGSREISCKEEIGIPRDEIERMTGGAPTGRYYYKAEPPEYDKNSARDRRNALEDMLDELDSTMKFAGRAYMPEDLRGEYNHLRDIIVDLIDEEHDLSRKG